MITLNTDKSVVELPEDGVFERPLTLGQPRIVGTFGIFTVFKDGESSVSLRWNANGEPSKPEILIDGLLSLSQYLIHREGISQVFIDQLNCDAPFSENNRFINLESISRHAQMIPTVRVAIIMLRNARGEFLMGKRPEGYYMPGVWEFPGGKIELGETPEEAGHREIHEELGIHVESSQDVGILNYCFVGNKLEGHLRLCSQWTGDPKAFHHEELQWVPPEELSRYAMPLSAILSLPKVLELKV